MSAFVGHLTAPSSGAVVSTRAPTSLQLTQGNAALRAGRYAEAVAEYGRLLMQAPELAETLAIADSLALARQRYRRERAATNAAPRVAVCGWSLGHNPAGRVDTLARLYQSLAEVEIIGCRFPNWGRELWAPIRQTPIPVHSFLVEDERRFIAQALELVLAHPYDLVHLSKPRLPNILIGLLYKWLWQAAVLVDVDDEELAFVGADAPLKLDQDFASSLDSLIGQTGTRLGVGLTTAFDGVTVANAALQSRYGGTIVRHARDERVFQPSVERRRRARDSLGIAPEQSVVIFLGTPRPHKGLLEIGQALADLGRPEALLLIIGAFPSSLRGLQEALRDLPGLNVRFLDDQPFERIPDLLAAGDMAVLMQDPGSLAACLQTPAKLSDALAMGLTVLAEPTPGLAEFVECGAVTAVSRAQLAPALRQALEEAGVKRRQVPVAHPAFVTWLSYAANRSVVQSLLALHGRGQVGAGRPAPELARLGVVPWFGPVWRALSRV
jgi:glycosyltransferase involved in cell wall biosynthesis